MSELGAHARATGAPIIRYQSVRDPQGLGCTAVLTPTAFSQSNPLELQTWQLTVTQARVFWHRVSTMIAAAFEFEMTRWFN